MSISDQSRASTWAGTVHVERARSFAVAGRKINQGGSAAQGCSFNREGRSGTSEPLVSVIQEGAVFLVKSCEPSSQLYGLDAVVAHHGAHALRPERIAEPVDAHDQALRFVRRALLGRDAVRERSGQFARIVPHPAELPHRDAYGERRPEPIITRPAPPWLRSRVSSRWCAVRRRSPAVGTRSTVERA